MKLGCCSWSYHRAIQAGRIDFEDWLRICAEELQVGGVDIIADQLPKRTTRYVLETKKRCADYRLTTIALSVSNDFGRPTAHERQRHIEAVSRWIDSAFILGVPYVRIFAGWPPADRRKSLWGPMKTCIRKVASVAAQAGVTLVVEPHNHGGFLPDSRTTLRLIKELDSPWVRINLDVGNYLDADLYKALDASMSSAPHVVAKIRQFHAGHDEDPTLDYGAIFSMLKRHRYVGFVTLEYEGAVDELEAVPRALAMLRRYATTHGL